MITRYVLNTLKLLLIILNLIKTYHDVKALISVIVLILFYYCAHHLYIYYNCDKMAIVLISTIKYIIQLCLVDLRFKHKLAMINIYIFPIQNNVK